MTFVNPLFLYGLFAVAIPVIIHLFTFRRYRKVYFSNVHFLKDIQVKSRRKSRLRQLIILMLRILVIICLVLAFAQPYMPDDKTALNFEDKSAVCLYVDNSFSMETENVNGILLEEARRKASEIVESYKNTDEFSLLTNDFEGRHNRFVSKEDVLNWISETDFSPVFRTQSEVVDRFGRMLKDTDAGNKIIYLISDFQKNTFNPGDFTKDTSLHLFLVPLSNPSTNNVYVDSCWFAGPVLHLNQQAELKVRLRNAGSENLERIPVKLFINGQQRAAASFNIQAEDSREITLPYTIRNTGIHSGSIEITDYPVLFDDIYYFSYMVSQRLPVLVIHDDEGENKYLNLLYRNDSVIDHQNVNINALDYSGLNNYRLIILNHLKEIPSGLAQSLNAYMNNGGSVALFPSEDGSINSYNSFLALFDAGGYAVMKQQEVFVDYVNRQHAIFKDVFEEIPDNADLPKVEAYFPLRFAQTDFADVLLELQNGDPLVASKTAEGGLLYISAVPLRTKFTNLPAHAVFVPLLYNMALLSSNQGLMVRWIGESEPLELRAAGSGDEDILKLKMIESDFEFIPRQQNSKGISRLFFNNRPQQAGNFMILSEGESIAGLSFNYDRNESQLNTYTREEIEELLNENEIKRIILLDTEKKAVSELIHNLGKGTRLWKLFIILALAFIAGEIAVIRLWKT